MQEITSLTIILPYIASGISKKELPTFIAEFRSSDISLKGILIQLSKDVHQSSSNIIVDTDIIRCKNKNIVRDRADLKVENAVELVYLF